MDMLYLFSFGFITAFLIPLWHDARQRPEYGDRPFLLGISLALFAAAAVPAFFLISAAASSARMPLVAALQLFYPVMFIIAEYSVHSQRIRKNLLVDELLSRIRIPIAVAIGLGVLVGLSWLPDTILSSGSKFFLLLLITAGLIALYLFGIRIFSLQEGIIRRRRYLFILGSIFSLLGMLFQGYTFANSILAYAPLLGLNILFAVRVFHEYFLYRMRHLNDIHFQHRQQEQVRTDLINEVLTSSTEEDRRIINGIMVRSLERMQNVISNPNLRVSSMMLYRRTGDLLAVDSEQSIIGRCVPLLNMESLKRMKEEAAREHIMGQVFEIAKIAGEAPLESDDFAGAALRLMMERREPVSIAPLPTYLAQIFKAVILNPIYNQDQLVAVLVLFKDSTDYIFPQERNILAELIGYLSIAATLIDGKRIQEDKNRLNKEMDVARQIQVSVLPKNMAIDGYDVAARMITATEVGGDLYDFAPTKFGNYLDVGDVAGHGLPAGITALIHMASFHAALQASHSLDKSLAANQIYDIINRVLVEINRNRIGSDKFMTGNVLNEKDGVFTYAGSHLVALIFRAATNAVEEIAGMTERAAFLGLSEYADSSQSVGRFELAKGDILLLYTDGLIEARGRDDALFGLDQLKDAFRSHATEPSEHIVEGIVERLRSFAENGDLKKYGGAYADDVSMVVLKRTV